MTKVKRITIHGFKSFAHKTDILFNDKYNCILGPNGSGKSNIGDALCFVLGRLSAKSMRAEKASNLIFNGGKNKKPASSGTVEISFTNEDHIFPFNTDEVTISRTITSNGNSIYRINDKKLTRTEIIDFLSLAHINPEGYNIILQGDIMRFVDMSPLERRKIIEEISDVALYEEKKHKAMLELQKVEEQLNSAEIILKERKTYLKELKKDRDQALKYKEVKGKIDSHKVTLIHHQIKEKENIQKQFDAEINAQQEKITQSYHEIMQLKAKIQNNKEETSKINQEIEHKGEQEQLKVHREIEDLKINLAKDKTRSSTLKDEIGKIQQRKDKFKEEIEELELRGSSFSEKQKELEITLSRKKQELIDIEVKISEFKKKHKIESSPALEKEMEEKEKLIEHKQEEIQHIRQKQQEQLREKDKMEYQLQSIDERIKKVQEIEKNNNQQLKTLHDHKNNFKNATLRLNQLLDQDSSFASQLSNARKRLVEWQERHSKLNAKALSAQAGLSSNEAVRSILENRKKLKGVFGTIAELGQTDKKYSLALDIAAGNRMQHIVVEDDKIAAECIHYLKNNKLGAASFIPLNKIKIQDISLEDKKLLKQEGVHDFALNLINYDQKYNKAFSFVFGNTLIVENIDTARALGIGRIKMTTIDGNSVEASGVMRGGFIGKKPASSFLEKESLEELNQLEKEIEELQSIIGNVELKREGNEKEISSLRNMKAELEAEIIKLEKTLHLGTQDLDANEILKKELAEKLNLVNNSLNDINRDVTSINKDLAGLKSKKQTLRNQINELRDPRLLAQLTAFEESKQRYREDIVKLDSELKNINMQIEQMIAPEREKIREIMKQHDKEESQFSEEIKKLSSLISQKETELIRKENESREFYSKYRELFNKREKLSAEINRSENEIENIREKSRAHERDLNLNSLKNAEIKARLAGLQEERGKYPNAEILENKNIEELQKETAEFEFLLTEMSAVNMKALEIYEQVETEYNKLIEKKESLFKEKTDVMTLMNEIETTKKEHFMKTFHKANENFERIFNSLFKKGKAYLQLDNPDNPFEDGLSIKVKLLGNRFLDIKSLSGGEKTLTALSFIFSIQEYQPASFYILDEIDAALDKHNSETLAKLIRAYADQAQYIVISHNDSIISEADVLYGISMNDGVSKVTSLKI
ncbi:chromosome segregation protein SMC [Candidatus Woesearchaeota archaeon]|nr:chromosome segregation protein SMC [Candidatus Woesearchaeota archaeon]